MVVVTMIGFHVSLLTQGLPVPRYFFLLDDQCMCRMR